jgi:hypothetical protein
MNYVYFNLFYLYRNSGIRTHDPYYPKVGYIQGFNSYLARLWNVLIK